MESNANSLFIERLPFYTGMQDKLIKADLPSTLPFELIFQENTGIITQKYNAKVDKWVERAYQIGSSLSTPLGEGSFSKKIAADIIRVILDSLGEKPLNECSFLEIGCGKGYLLHVLKEMGAKSCLGIEPDPHSREGSQQYNVEIIQDFFQPDRINRKFDVIFTYGVLEHIYNPLDFIQGQKECLAQDGIIFSAVPNCEKSLYLGDYSLLAHEHYNYFTRSSLTSIYSTAGIRGIQSKNAEYGWALYMWGKLDNPAMNSGKNILRGTVIQEKELFCNYIKRCRYNMETIQAITKKHEGRGYTIGIYGADPTFMLFNWSNAPRYFDGDVSKHGMYLPCCSNPVESPYALLENPVDILFVAPINYDKEIRDFLHNEIKLPGEAVISMKDLFEKQGKLEIV